MKVLDPGHRYQLAHLDGSGVGILTFVKRVGEKYPGNETAYEGTNCQEVLRALIDRLKYVNGQIPSEHTRHAITHLRLAMGLLEERAAIRHGRSVQSFPVAIEEMPTCSRCGHVNCFEMCAKAEGAEVKEG